MPGLTVQPQALRQMQRGIAAMAELLAVTLGPAGSPVVSTGNRPHQVDFLDDSATIVRRILSFGDPRLDVGAMIVRNVVWRVGQRAGDGGAMTAVLLRALVDGGVRQVAAGANAMLVTQGMRLGADLAITALRRQARPLSDVSQLAAAARSMTRDESLASVLGEISYLLGPDAYVQIETYMAPYVERTYVAGAVYGARISSSSFYTESQHRRATLASPAIALLDQPLTSAEAALPLLNAAVLNGHDALLIVAPEIGGSALNLMVANHTQPADKRRLRLLGATLTAVGDERAWALRDLAMLTGATLLGGHAPRSSTQAEIGDLGAAVRVEYAADRLAITASPDRRKAVQTEVNLVRGRLQRLALDDAERPALVRRLAALTGGLAVLKVGATSALATEVRRVHAERGLKVLSLAQQGGLAPGGGAAFLHCAKAVIDGAKNWDGADEVRTGMQVVANALSAPLHRLLANAGVHPASLVVESVRSAGAPATFDVTQEAVVDAFSAGVVDATDVLVTVLQSAISGATMALSTDEIVYHRAPEASMEP
ncbi:MAG: hypothetical protein IPK16_10300 [Anaerolineales bacterium]|nr:hypothetical protein [Anaerolineales bacterium]